MKKIIGIIIACALIAGAVLLLAGNRKKIQEQTSSSAITDMTEVVSTYRVSLVPVDRTFSSNAMVQANTELNFVSDITGRVTEIYVDKGSRVQKGTPLLKIDTELIEADYKAALAAYTTIKKDEERFTRSNEVGGVTDQQLDNIKAQVTAAESRLAMSRWKLDNAVVKSPMSGTVNMKFIENGSLIAPNAPLFEIVDDSRLKMNCMVPESRIKEIKAGDRITATDSGNSSKTFTGTVKSLGVKTDRSLNYPVEIILDRDSDLHVGMYLNVSFHQDEAMGILVPRKAVVGSAMAANVYLAVDGRAVRREVSLGNMHGDSIEITEGLSEGDTIIVSGLMNVSDGTEIKVVE